MSSAAFVLYHQTLRSFLSGEFEAPAVSAMSAHLLVPTFVPNTALSATVATVAGFELAGSDYQPRALTGHAVLGAGDVWSFTSDPILFGDPVTLPHFRYVVLAGGHVNAPASSKPLLAYLDLGSNGTAREVVKGSLVIRPDAGGWFSITQP